MGVLCPYRPPTRYIAANGDRRDYKQYFLKKEENNADF